MFQVWRVDGDKLSLLPAHEQTKFYRGDCYVVLYTYASIGKDENLLYTWFGRASLMVRIVCSEPFNWNCASTFSRSNSSMIPF